MLLSNNTSNYYYITGSYPLPPEDSVTIPDEVYNNDDSIAKQINSLDEATAITVSSAPTGYPRSIGVVAEQIYPMQAWLLGFPTPENHSNYNGGRDASGGPFGERWNSDVNGAWIEWTVALQEGTYSLFFKGYAHNGGGIVVISIDGTNITDSPYNASEDTIDLYDAGGNGGFYSEISNLVIPASGSYTFRATVTGKNASSGGYVSNIAHMYVNKAPV